MKLDHTPGYSVTEDGEDYMRKYDFTPGPWKKEWQEIINAARGIESAVNGESWKDKKGDYNDRVNANINLIAAAPDMIKELIKLYRGLYGNYEPSMQSEYEAKRELQQLIESATGKKIEEVMG